ncbi:hypothetical protein [Chryseobacterium indologenes]|uniref:Uncharacterized protein n=1 Tax=Chryseobacterium indologenes TaxID=253 RepID=A0A0N0ZT74_CHRID|nr:hypothetical protein [Chryseobacterium indologenes]KPE50106.1 hypothetical protein AOB46_16845 [Chryseobacterium indologenes]
MRVHKKDDYVRYVGNYPYTHDSSKDLIGLIDEISPNNIEAKIFVETHSMLVRLDQLRPLETKEEHLINLGFTKVVKNNMNIYQKGNLTISETAFVLNQLFINAGFRLGDLSGLNDTVIRNNYLDQNLEFNMNKFQQDFPNLNNINDFIEVYSKYHINFSRKVFFGDL